MVLNSTNLNYTIISIIILIIIGFIFLKVKTEQFKNNNTETKLEKFADAAATPTKEYFSIILYGTLAQLLFNANNIKHNLLLTTNTTYWPERSSANPQQSKSTNVIDIAPNGRGYISGLTASKKYKLEVFVDLTNHNFDARRVWILYVCPFKSTFTPSTSIATENDFDFTRQEISIIYDYVDHFQYTFSVSTYITGWTGFSIFLQNNAGIKVAGTQGVVNASINISVLEI